MITLKEAIVAILIALPTAHIALMWYLVATINKIERTNDTTDRSEET